MDGSSQVTKEPILENTPADANLVPVDLNYVLIEEMEEEFFRTPTQAQAADIVNHHLDKIVYEPVSGNFYRRHFNESYYHKLLDPLNTVRGTLEKRVDIVFKRLIDDSKGVVIHKQMSIVLKKIRAESFIRGVLRFFSEKVTIDPIPWDQVTEVIACRDSVIDFSGAEPFSRSPRNDEYFLNFIDLKAEEVINAAKPVQFNAFLKTLFPDTLTCKTAKDIFSLMISGKGGKYFVVWTGEVGNNGKTVTSTLIQDLLGMKANTLKSAVIMKGVNQSERRFSEIELRGTFAAFIDEAEGALDVAQIKRLQGGGRIKAENKGEKAVEFSQTWILVVMTNRLPTFYPPDDTPFLERLIVLPFNSVFYGSEEQRERYLHRGVQPQNLHPEIDKDEMKKELQQEYPAILLQLINDYIKLRDEKNCKVFESPECLKAKENYRKDNDTIENFFDDYLLQDSDGFIPNSRLVEIYSDFTGNNKTSIRKLRKLLIEKYSFISEERNSSERGLGGVRFR